MDNFLKRLKYYGIGFGIGTLFVVFFFKNRGCAWFPENRVKNMIFSKVLVISESEKATMDKLHLSKKELLTALNDGDVAFSESQKNKATKAYKFDCETTKGKVFSCYLTLNENSFVSEILFSPKTAQKAKPSKKGYGTILRYPKNKDLVFVDTTDVLTCKQKELGFKDANAIFYYVRKKGKIDFEKSNADAEPRPEFTFHTQKFDAKGIWVMEKIKIVSIEPTKKTACQ